MLLDRLLRNGRQVLPLYIRCGLLWEAAELYWLRRLLSTWRRPRLSPLCVVRLPMRDLYGAHWSFTGRRIPSTRSVDAAVYLPGRNAILLTAAAITGSQRQISTIVLGTLRGNPFGDATPQFFRDMGRGLTQALRHPIQVIAPLRHLSKAQAIRAANSVPFELTFSCLRPRGRRHCGDCNKCAERRRAFHEVGVSDPVFQP